MWNNDPDKIMIDYGLCSWCIGRGCPMCEGTGEHQDPKEKENENGRFERKD